MLGAEPEPYLYFRCEEAHTGEPHSDQQLDADNAKHLQMDKTTQLNGAVKGLQSK